jgi:hypothetical protein
MSKEIVQKFYKSDALIDSEIIKDFLHPEVVVEWNSSKGLIQLNYDSLLNLSNDLSKAFKVRISHIVSENDRISVRYSHFVKRLRIREKKCYWLTLVIWEIKDNKLFRGYQMSQLSNLVLKTEY